MCDKADKGWSPHFLAFGFFFKAILIIFMKFFGQYACETIHKKCRSEKFEENEEGRASRTAEDDNSVQN
jgi:hypothetical protein